MNEHNYNRINEGGEGYNPCQAKREREEWEAEREEARRYAQTPQGKIDALHRRIERECGSVAREWGDMKRIDALQNDLYSQIKKIEGKINAEFLAIWTPEETQKRRSEWNTRVKAGEFGSGKVNFKAVRGQEQEQGWTLDQLKKAIKLNKED